MRTRTRIAILHGVNLDALDRRPADHYGGLTFSSLERAIGEFAHALGQQARFFQSNHEGDFIEEIHKTPDYVDAILLNPGAWTHYAWSIRDALEVAALPAAEVHLSDVTSREPFRRQSVISDLCVTTVAGQGVEGYRIALERLRDALA